MNGDGFRIVIGGGGVAALEGALAVREELGEAAELTIVSASSEFVYSALGVAEPFGGSPPRRLSLRRFATDVGASLRIDAIAGVDGDGQTALTASGEQIAYDALLLAVGADRVEAVRGALTYRGAQDNEALYRVVLELIRGEASSIAFAIPGTVRWGLPAYELALMTAAHLRERGHEADVSLVTAEERPLALFGERAAANLEALLKRAGVSLRTSAAASAVERGGLVLASGELVQVDRVVAMPRLEVKPLPGLPQGPHGFVDTDAFMRVVGLDRVWVAGDASWFPIKQGGIAAQQADTAASAIAALSNGRAERRPFRPVLRGALITGEAPQYLRRALGDPDAEAAAGGAPLWWPPGKIAGRHLAPYLAAAATGEKSLPALEDLEPTPEEELELDEREHREAVGLALTAADAEARWEDFGMALRWLEVAEQLDLTLPSEYVTKREIWRAQSRNPAP